MGAHRTHGVYAIKDRGERTLEEVDRSLLMELEEQLASPEGIDELLRRRAALGVIMVTKLEDYVKSQVDSGVSIQEIPILKSWPQFQNAAGRALKAAKDTLPKNGGSKYGAELEHIARVVSGEVETD